MKKAPRAARASTTNCGTASRPRATRCIVRAQPKWTANTKRRMTLLGQFQHLPDRAPTWPSEVFANFAPSGMSLAMSPKRMSAESMMVLVQSNRHVRALKPTILNGRTLQRLLSVMVSRLRSKHPSLNSRRKRLESRIPTQSRESRSEIASKKEWLAAIG